MVKRVTLVAAPLAALALLAGCGGPAPKPAATHPPSSASTAAAASSSVPAVSGPQPDPLYCSTVVDSDPASSGLKGWEGGDTLTAEQVIAYLVAMEIIDGIKNISYGTLSADDTTILDGADLDLKNYNGTQLADDANTFASDEESYNPGGPVDTSYAKPLLADILTLQKDCRQSSKDALKIVNS